MIKVALLLSRFDMTGMTTNTIDLYHGLKHFSGEVDTYLIVGDSSQYRQRGVERFYNIFTSDDHFITYKSDLSNKPRSIATAWRVARLLRRGSFDLVHCESPYYTFIPKFCGIPFIATMHVTDIHPTFFYRRGAHVISISRETTDWAIKVCKHRAADVTMVPHGVSLRFAQPLSYDLKQSVCNQYSLPTDKVIISLVGSIEPRKGHDLLLKAVAALPISIRQAAHIIFVGSDKSPGKKSQHWLDSEIQKSGLPTSMITHIEFCDPYPIYQLSDIMTLPSRQEGFPLTVIEAMMARCAVVRTTSEGADIQINDGIDGFLFHIDDVAHFSQILARLITDKELRDTISIRAQQKAIDQFSETTMARNTLSVYRKILAPEITPPIYKVLIISNITNVKIRAERH